MFLSVGGDLWWVYMCFLGGWQHSCCRKFHLSTSGTIALINNIIYFLPSKKKISNFLWTISGIRAMSKMPKIVFWWVTYTPIVISITSVTMIIVLITIYTPLERVPSESFFVAAWTCPYELNPLILMIMRSMTSIIHYRA